MNILFEKKNFIEAVHNVGRFAEKKSATLPALSAILIIATKESIKFRATNLETGVDYTVEGTCSEEGVVAIPAVVLQQLATSFSGEGNMTLEHTGNTVTVTSGAGKSTIKTVPAEDFPSIPFPETRMDALRISGALLRSILATSASCASTSTVRPELASILMNIEGGSLTAVATDSFRLSEKKIPLVSRGAQGRILLPAKNASDIAQSLPDDEIAITFDEHQCSFQTTHSTFVSRLTSATYPDYQQIIPKDFVVEATVLRKDFEHALKRMTIFADTFQKVKVSFDQKAKKVTLHAQNTDIGDSTEALSAHITGESIDLSFNHRYLSSILSLTTADSLSLSAAGAGRPLIMRGVGDASLLYLVSPMNQ
jgi:DNA polymerase-3 subunit beta